VPGAKRSSSIADPTASPRVRWGIPLLILAVVFALFGPALRHEFVAWDDQLNIYDNDDFKPPTAAAIAHYWNPQHPKLELYIPLTYTVWGALAAGVASDPVTGEIRPGAYHGMNVLLHGGAALLVFALLRRLGAPPWPACGGALLFAVHPVQVDAVAWATGMKDVLSGVLCLAALVAYLKSTAEQERGRRGLYYGLAGVSFLAALLAKPSAVTLPVVAGLLAVLGMRRRLGTTILEMLPWLLLSALFVIEGKRAQPASTVHYVPPLLFRPVVALDALAFYVGKLLLPVTLVIDYGRSPAWLRHSPQRYWTWICTVVLAAAALLAWLRSQREPSNAASDSPVAAAARAPAIALLVFVFALLPVLGLVPFEFQNNTTVADHYLYFAMLGPAIVAAIALWRWRHRRAVIAIAIVGLVALAVRTELQLRYWHDDEALFLHARETNPDAIAGRLSLVLGLHRLHDGRLAEARDLFDDALRADPTNVDAAVNIGSALAAEGRNAEAVEQYRHVISEHPDAADAHYNLGNLLLRGGRPADAVAHYEAALGARPGLSSARANLAVAHAMIGDGLAEHGDFAGALPHFAAAVQLDPTFIVARQKYEKLRQLLRQQAPPQTAPTNR
jgi:Tfp pilus assembly protein PilF